MQLNDIVGANFLNIIGTLTHQYYFKFAMYQAPSAIDDASLRDALSNTAFLDANTNLITTINGIRHHPITQQGSLIDNNPCFRLISIRHNGHTVAYLQATQHLTLITSVRQVERERIARISDYLQRVH